MDGVGSVAGAAAPDGAAQWPACRDRIFNASRWMPFRAGWIAAKGAGRDPVTGTETALLRVVPLSGGGVYTYSLDRLAAVQEGDGGSAELEYALRWCAAGPPAPVEPQHILFCARHPAAGFCYLYPPALLMARAAGLGESVREDFDLTPVDGSAPVSAWLTAEQTGHAAGALIHAGGLIAWDRTPEACVDRVLTLAEGVAPAPGGPRVPRAGFRDEGHRRAMQAAAVVRGMCGDATPVVGVRIDAVLEDVLWTFPDLQALAALSPMPACAVESVEALSAQALPSNPTCEPRVVVVRGVGAWALHPDLGTARAAARIFEQFIALGRRAGGILPAGRIPPDLWPAAARVPAKPLTGRTALVTGGCSGIGLAIVRRLHAEGACVLMVDVNEDRLASEVELLQAQGEPEAVAGVVCDVRDPEAVDRALDEAVLRWGGLDILVNCAGLSLSRSLEETTPEEYDLQNSVMPRGSFLCSRAAARIMREQGTGGDIVYVASKNGLYAGPNNVAYGTAKAAQIHQARLLAAELAGFRIRVNVVNPDAVVRGSGIFGGGWGEDRARTYGVKLEDLGKHYASRSLLKEEILPEDIAAAVFVLVGPELRKSTGLVLNVDGGFAPAMVR